MAYLPFGEVLFEEHSSSFSSPYLFNGKELDRETGLSYYGARYYSLKENIWYGVDPLAEKMPNYGGYVFTFNNPIRFTDPTGMIAEDIEPNRKATEGEIHHDSNDNTTYRGNKNGTWTQATDLNEVVARGDKSLYVNNQPSEQIDLSEVIGTASTLATVGSELQYSKTFQTWKGINGKMYKGLSGRGPNGATGFRGFAKAKAGKIGVGGAILGGLSMIATEVEYSNSLNENYGPNMSKHLADRRKWDQLANGTGFLGLYGATASFGYNLGHLIEGVFDCNIQYNPYTRDFTPIEQTLMEYDRLGIILD